MDSIYPNKKILIYTGGSNIGNIKVDWIDADCVITTATITVGINFNEEHFHNIFIYASSLSHNLVSDIFQSHFRVRHIKNNKLYYHILPKMNKTFPTEYKELHKNFNWKENYFINKHRNFETSEYHFKELVINNIYEQNMSSMYLEKMFKYYAKECNYSEESIDDKVNLGDMEFDIDPSEEKIDLATF